MVTEVYVDVSFNAAHWLPRLPAGHKCQGIHGHTYRIQLRVKGEPNADGVVIMYETIIDAWHRCHKLLDHKLLNDVEGLSNPTSELIGAWILEAIPELTSVWIRETEEAGCTVFREDALRANREAASK